MLFVALLLVAARPLVSQEQLQVAEQTKEPEKKGVRIDDLHGGEHFGEESPGPEGEKVKKVVVDEKGNVISPSE